MHTKGPWDEKAIYTLLRNAWKNSMSVMGGDIGEVVRDGYDFPYYSMDIANLIAAAPDLLEALEEMVRYYAGPKFFSDEAIDTQAIAAIAKAKGE